MLYRDRGFRRNGSSCLCKRWSMMGAYIGSGATREMARQGRAKSDVLQLDRHSSQDKIVVHE